ncbi:MULTISPECIES: hypothetical protein [Streptomyces]|uniref:hypothetical protein n=1 Tax=Streptomyces TaxID=1883 RepID=UPI00163B9263|nr:MULTISPECIES: hypothetical protein [Streptomyces]MBC2875850.1 hypothetical protein [Streptomyces sp. TYQ1024]UBI37699.1 hypothetical protein K7I03_15270 [Streptomyces mobaraensis]UKW30285.1 hypothetical protein MCU78_15230 [Streptomyces sp. TYQ1024]
MNDQFPDRRPHDSQSHDSRPHDSQSHAERPHEAQPYDGQPHDSRPHDIQPHGAHSLGAPSPGAQPHGAQPYGSPQSDDRPLDGRPLDEQALRRMLQGAVENLEPSDDALEHLRRAVPARRTRRRQALGGAVAAVVLVGAAVPALMHVADTVGVLGSDDRPANAANSHRHAEETVGAGERDGGPADTARPGGGTAARGEHRVEQPGGEAGTPEASREPSRPHGTAGSTSPTPGVTFSAAAPTCDRAQLGKGSGTVGAADGTGRVYGAFRIVNVSHALCAVTGPGELVAQTGGGAQKARVSVVDHTAGDPAAGLPDPERAPSTVVLRPGQAYEVKFAWIPATSSGSAGCTKAAGTATPPPAASAPGKSVGRDADAPAASISPSPPAVVPPETPAPPAPTGSVTLTNTPVAGEPAAAEARIPDACAGTVYHTGALPAVAPPT